MALCIKQQWFKDCSLWFKGILWGGSGWLSNVVIGNGCLCCPIYSLCYDGGYAYSHLITGVWRRVRFRLGYSRSRLSSKEEWCKGGLAVVIFYRFMDLNHAVTSCFSIFFPLQFNFCSFVCTLEFVFFSHRKMWASSGGLKMYTASCLGDVLFHGSVFRLVS